MRPSLRRLSRLEVNEFLREAFKVPASSKRVAKENSNITIQRTALSQAQRDITAKMEAASSPKPEYSTWSQEKLIERVTQLEKELKAKNAR